MCPGKQKAIIVDLDGTLCNTDHRAHFGIAREYEEFNAKANDDGIYSDVATFLHLVSSSHEIVAITARPEKYRKLTMWWLVHHKVPVDHLIMRPMDDFRHDWELKMDLVRSHFGSIEAALARVLCVLEDRTRVVDEYRKHGFACWHVREGIY